MDYEKELQKERDRRIAAEVELERLKKKLGEYVKLLKTLNLLVERAK